MKIANKSSTTHGFIPLVFCSIGAFFDNVNADENILFDGSDSNNLQQINNTNNSLGPLNLTSVKHNVITIQIDPLKNQSPAVKNIYGAFSQTEDVTNNTVNLNNSASDPITGKVYGAQSISGKSINNLVNINDGKINKPVYGGFSKNNHAMYNRIIVNGEFVATNKIIYGGFSNSGDAIGNRIDIIRGDVNNSIRGGQSKKGDAINNSVNITSKGTTFEKDIRGGQSKKGNANQNQILIDIGNGIIKKTVYGGFSSKADANQNSMVIYSGEFKKNIAAGRSDSDGSASNNTLMINGGTFRSNIYGGQSKAGGNTQNNLVILNGGDIIGGVFGGNRKDFTGNRLSIIGHQDTVKTIGKFQYYDFVIPATIENAAQLSITGNKVNLKDTTITIKRIQPGGEQLSQGDVITLIDKTKNADDLTQFFANDVNKGISLIYDFEQVNTPNQLQIRVADVTFNQQLKALNEGQIAGIAMLNQGADHINQLMHDMTNTEPNNWFSFSSLSGNNSRYNSGSYVDLQGLSLLAGIARKSQNSLTGIFFEGGWGNYDSYNSFTNFSSVSANGDTYHYGGGIFNKIAITENFYIDSAMRLGKTSTTFSTDQIANQYVNYETSAMYVGAQAGLGYLIAIDNQFNIDVFSRYMWTYQDGDSVTINSENVDFSAINSHRLRSGARLNYLHAIFSPYVGLAYEREFAGSAKASYQTGNVDAPSLQGDTGIGELGINISHETTENIFSVNLGIQGYIGKREGVSGSLTATWQF